MLDSAAARDAAPPMWNVRIVSCVPGSPMDCAAITPMASPLLMMWPRAGHDRSSVHTHQSRCHRIQRNALSQSQQSSLPAGHTTVRAAAYCVEPECLRCPASECLPRSHDPVRDRAALFNITTLDNRGHGDTFEGHNATIRSFGHRPDPAQRQPDDASDNRSSLSSVRLSVGLQVIHHRFGYTIVRRCPDIDNFVVAFARGYQTRLELLPDLSNFSFRFRDDLRVSSLG